MADPLRSPWKDGGMSRMRKKTVIGAALMIGLGIGVLRGNKSVKVTHHEIKNEKIPSSISGYTIVHVSDYHNTLFGKNNKVLVDKIKENKPDLIAVTGDLIDSRTTDLDVALLFMKEMRKIAPVYYVSGNHESRIPEYAALENSLKEIDVEVLNCRMTIPNEELDPIYIYGVQDPAFARRNSRESERDIMKKQLDSLPQYDHKYTILLSHRPELLDLYAEYSFDLVLSGHAHGGQIRLPLLGGILAPNQGFFPMLTSGMHHMNDTAMIISRGIGNSAFPLRVNNPPELIVIKLFPET